MFGVTRLTSGSVLRQRGVQGPDICFFSPKRIYMKYSQDVQHLSLTSRELDAPGTPTLIPVLPMSRPWTVLQGCRTRREQEIVQTLTGSAGSHDVHASQKHARGQGEKRVS